ncbi:MAG: carbohydrate ABC transporter permease [Ferrovibrio sp.]|uniref:carbohydrate ABC transporter permease n=1 Tax=Ferrovibrio sp. TaxID=1917215 RepID=UPI00262C4133|nr:carbohydrate ABC transporter permease [Ferrovibrio sp.]MCW0233898.1 carbohydrate ABC transporter permease [Ferrovibrio sp.]
MSAARPVSERYRMGRLSPAARLLRHLVLLAGATVMLVPFVWMISTSLKPPNEIFSADIALLPQTWHAVENYTAAFTKQPLLRYLANGLLVCAAIFIGQVTFMVPAAYAIAKLRFPGRDALFGIVLLALLIPTQVTAIPLYILFYKIGILDTYAALVVPSVISVFGIFLMRQFFRTVPDDLIHAARLDGCSELAIVWRIVLPTAMPAIVAFGILSLVWHWNDYFWPLLVVTSPELATPPLGIVFFDNQEAGTDFGPLMAGAVIITAPLLLAFLFAQRRFIEGVTMSGVK